MDWKEIFKPTIGKLIIPVLFLIVVVYFNFFMYPIRNTLNLLIVLVIIYLFMCLISTWRDWPPIYRLKHLYMDHEDRVKYERQQALSVRKNIFLIFGIGIVALLIGFIVLKFGDQSRHVVPGVKLVVLGVLILLAFLIYTSSYRKKKKNNTNRI